MRSRPVGIGPRTRANLLQPVQLDQNRISADDQHLLSCTGAIQQFNPSGRIPFIVEIHVSYVIFGAHLNRTPAEAPAFHHVHFGAGNTLISERRSIAPVFRSGKRQFLVAGRLSVEMTLADRDRAEIPLKRTLADAEQVAAW